MTQKFLLAIAFVFSLSQATFSQCNAGETAFYMVIHTDNWPEENHYQIVPSGSGCGVGVLAEGGNSNVDCSGNAAANSADGFAANSTLTTATLCIPTDGTYDLILIDTYGDGGTVYEMYENGVLMHVVSSNGHGNTYTFTPGITLTPTYDQPCQAAEVTVDGGAILLNNSEAYSLAGEIAPPAGDCAVSGFWCEGAVNNSVWAFFTATEGDNYIISTCNAGSVVDSQLGIYRVGDCADWSTYQLVTANDDQFNGCNAGDGYSSTAYIDCAEAGIYYIQLDGYNGAAGNMYLTVSTNTESPSLEAAVIGNQCPLGKSDPGTGFIIPFAIGADTDFTCTWTGPNGYTSSQNIADGLYPGSYTVILTTSCGVELTNTYNVTQPTQWDFTPTIVRPDCELSDNGSIDLSVGGATFPYTYAWTGPNGLVSDQAAITGLGVGNYDIVVTDENGCVAQQGYSLTAVNDYVFNLGEDITLCQNQQYILTGPLNMTYQWFDGSPTAFYVIDFANWGLGAHEVSLTATNTEGCFYTDYFQFTYDGCIGVSEAESLSDILVYPNPNENDFTISLPPSNEQIQITIFDASGRKVWAGKKQRRFDQCSAQLCCRFVPSSGWKQGDAGGCEIIGLGSRFKVQERAIMRLAMSKTINTTISAEAPFMAPHAFQ